MRLRHLMLALVVLHVLPGCSRQSQANSGADGQCPELEGRYAIPRGMATELATGGLADASRSKAVEISGRGATGYRLRWLLDDGAMRSKAEALAVSEPARYARWFGLLYGELGEAVMRNGGPVALDRSLAAAGPTAESETELRPGTHYQCDRGALRLQGVELRRKDGALQLSAQSVRYRRLIDLWCGDGCKGIDVPAGKQHWSADWSQTTAWTPWRPGSAERAALPEPRGVALADRGTFGLQPLPDAPGRFANPGEVRRRVQALAGSGTQVTDVAVEGGSMRVRYEAPEADEHRLLDRIRDLSSSGAWPHGLERDWLEGGRVRVGFLLDAASPLVSPAAPSAPVLASTRPAPQPTAEASRTSGPDDVSPEATSMSAPAVREDGPMSDLVAIPAN